MTGVECGLVIDEAVVGEEAFDLDAASDVVECAVDGSPGEPFARGGIATVERCFECLLTDLSQELVFATDEFVEVAEDDRRFACGGDVVIGIG